MSVTSVALISERSRSSIKDGVETHHVVWRVICNSTADGTAVAIFANDGTTAIPASGSTHPTRTGCTLRELDAQPKDEGSARVFIVEGEYSSDTGAFADQLVYPTSRAWEYSRDAAEYTEEYFIDKSPTPKAVINSAGEPFETNPTRERADMILTITRNEASENVLTDDGFSNVLNSDPVMIDGQVYAAGVLKMSPIKSVKTTEKFNQVDVTYYRRTFVIKVKKAGWDDVFLDTGCNELSSSKLKPIVDNNGMPVRRPYPLNGSGSKQSSPTTAPSQLTFKPYDKAAWAGLMFV